MKNLLWNWIISVAALALAAWALQRGISVTPWYTYLWLAPLLGLVNVVVGALTRVLAWFSQPVNLLTLGCFGFILSLFGYAVAIYLIGRNSAFFHVKHLGWALALAVVMAIFSSVLNMILPNPNKQR